MRFWDASAIVPLVLSDSQTTAIVGIDDESPMCVWWGTIVEAVSAIARRERAGTLTGAQVKHCLSRLNELADSWVEVPPSDALRESAQRLLRDTCLESGRQLAALRGARDLRRASQVCRVRVPRRAPGSKPHPARA